MISWSRTKGRQCDGRLITTFSANVDLFKPLKELSFFINIIILIAPFNLPRTGPTDFIPITKFTPSFLGPMFIID
jgi:hypothetical protein